MKERSLGSMLAATVVGVGMCSPTVSSACTMSLPPPSNPSNEYEIEVEFEGYDSSSDRVKYKVEIEVEVFNPTQATQCQCALGLGSIAALAPASFKVNRAGVGVVQPGNDFELPEFDGFTEDNAVSSAVEGLPNFQAGGTGFGFSVDIASLDLSAINSGDLVKLIFEFEFDPDDFDQVNGNSIQFAAGSPDPGHALSLFTGYNATLQLPSFGVIPEPASFLVMVGLGCAGLTKRGFRMQNRV